MSNKCHKDGFTLIELLVVMGIIALLAGLIIGSAYPTMRFNAMKNDTERRVSNLNLAVDMRQSEHADRIEALIEVTANRSLRLRPLGQVISTALKHHGTSIADLSKNSMNILPPRIRTRAWVEDKGVSNWMRLESSWLISGSGLEHHIAFHDRQIAYRRDDPDIEEAVDIWGPVLQRSGFVHPLFNPDDMTLAREFVFTVRNYTQSPIGESLDRTLEASPQYSWRSDDSAPANCDYRNAWPNLKENELDDGVTFEQESWGWEVGENWKNNNNPFAATPFWGSPWGQGVISRNPERGNQVAYVEKRAFREVMNPLVTPGILAYAGLFDAHGGDAEVWRSDRNPRQQWNDAWGNPLFISAAIYHAPRYDFVDTGSFAELKDGDSGRKLGSREIHGGRDFLFRRAREVYGYGRGIYVAAGAIGPANDFDGDVKWDETSDVQAIRAAWTYITDRALPPDRDDEGWNWDETSFESAPAPPQDNPWQGVRIYPDFSRNSDPASFGQDRRNPVFLSAPVLIR